MQADTAPVVHPRSSLDLAATGEDVPRLPLRTAIWVIAALSTLLWAAIVGLVSALS